MRVSIIILFWRLASLFFQKMSIISIDKREK